MSNLTENQKPIRNELQAGRVRSAWIFLSPMIVVLLIVAAWPLSRSVWFSLTDASLLHLYDAKYIGFKNYFKVLHTDSGETLYFGVLMDKAWWNAVWNTLRFGVVSVVLETALGMAVALVLNAKFKGRGFVRAAILIPWAIPTVVSAKMWGWMLNDQLGIVNDMLIRIGLIHEKIAWAADANYSMIAVVGVDTWKTVPFMALLILAGLQMVPGDVYEAAEIDGVHPVKVFFKVTLPLVLPALMVAVIFRMMDALRIFDLVYILTPNSSQTKTMSVIARENLFDFDKFAYGSAESTLLFLFLLIVVTLYIKAWPSEFRWRRAMIPAWFKTTAFYAFVVIIVLQAVFPFYYAIVTSFKTGAEIFEISYFPRTFHLDNYYSVLFSGNGSFLRNIWNSVWVSSITVIVALFIAVTASYALSRVRFRGRSLMLMTILCVSMFPQVAVLAGLFEVVRALGLYNTDWSLIFSYTIFTLPFTVWVLTTFMRDLPIELEEAAIVDGATPWVIVSKIFMPLMWPALVTTGLLAFIAAWNEYLYALTFTASNDAARTVPVGIALLSGNSEHEIPWGPIMAASVIVTVPLIALVLIFQRKIIAGLTAGGVKG